MKRIIICAVCFLGSMLCVALSQDAASPETSLLGTWSVKIDKYEDTWTFKEGGLVTSAKQPKLKGSWKKMDNCILMQWDEVEKGFRTWEAFTLPLKKIGTQGGNWRGAKVTASKVEKTQ